MFFNPVHPLVLEVQESFLVKHRGLSVILWYQPTQASGNELAI